MTVRSADPVAPSKTARDENFPVGSWLLPAALRPYVASFYAVVRAADDIADSPALSAEEKIARLEAVDVALRGETPVAEGCERAARLRSELGVVGVDIAHARDLLKAFTQDATKLRYDDWDDLLGYCRLSANPVGRFLLDLHGEDGSGHAASDALCTALQIINHLQDCRDDYRDLDRVYLPLDFFAAAGARIEELDAPAASPALRRVLDRALDGVDALLAAARPLSAHIRHPGMRREAAVIVALAERLAIELGRRDPLAERVELSLPQKLGCALRGLTRTLFTPGPNAREDVRVDPKAYVRERVRRSGSSFYWAMWFLSKPRREAMFAIYAFCREVDDIADGVGTREKKSAALAAWADEIAALYEGAPRTAIARALVGPVSEYGLRREDFEEILRGVGMDVRDEVRAPDMDTLKLYCSRVAGAVGLLSVRVFGCADPRADSFALAVGQALQLTNILRDVGEDAAVGRLYMPRELLDAAGIHEREPRAVAGHPALPEACAALARLARSHFDEARTMLAAMSPGDRATLRPAVVMMAVYSRLLDRLVRADWRRLEPPVSLPRAEKMWIALRHGIL
ncbi:MAG: presqualene diphosphate synthase HpnD [Alphaproteobacteria bacterium]